MQNKPEAQKHADQFSRSLYVSLLLHGFFVVILTVQSVFFSRPHLDISQAISVSIGELKNSERLPEKIQSADNPVTAASPKVAEKAPVKEEAPKANEKKIIEKTEKPDVDLKANKSKQQKALAQLKKSSALEKIKQELKKEAASKVQQTRHSRSTSSRSYIVPAGTALSGLDRLQADEYLALLDQRIKQNWALPQWLINKPLKARILVKINEAGQLLSLSALSTSGNTSYDQYCMSAIEKAAPFPTVPEKLSEKFRVDGIVVGFPE